MQQYTNYHSQNAYLQPAPQTQKSPYHYTTPIDDNSYKPVASDELLVGGQSHVQAADQRLKQRIRILKLISRVVAFIISLVTLVPLAMTVAKFLLTKNEQFTVNGQERTAWAAESITWYTFMYFGVSLISCLFNFAILVAYWRGVKQANNVASIASWWSHTVLVGHVLIWVVSAAIYRYGREPVDGKFRDLWGWTCSPAADAIQSQIPNINYGQYCTMQTASFYSGLVNVATGLLSALILLLAGLRLRSKKRAAKTASKHQLNLEPLRS